MTRPRSPVAADDLFEKALTGRSLLSTVARLWKLTERFSLQEAGKEVVWMQGKTFSGLPTISGGTRTSLKPITGFKASFPNEPEPGKCPFCPGSERQVQSRAFFDAEGHELGRHRFMGGAEEPLEVPDGWGFHLFANKATPWVREGQADFHGLLVRPNHDDPFQRVDELSALLALVDRVIGDPDWGKGGDATLLWHWGREAGQNLKHCHLHIVVADRSDSLHRPVGMELFSDRVVKSYGDDGTVYADGVSAGDLLIVCHGELVDLAPVLTEQVASLRQKLNPDIAFSVGVRMEPNSSTSNAVVHPITGYLGASEIMAMHRWTSWSLRVPHETVAEYLRGEIDVEGKLVT